MTVESFVALLKLVAAKDSIILAETEAFATFAVKIDLFEFQSFLLQLFTWGC